MKRVHERGPPDLRARSKPYWLPHHAPGSAPWPGREGPFLHRLPHRVPAGWIETVISLLPQLVIQVGSRWSRCRPAARDGGHLRPGPRAAVESWTHGKRGVPHLVACAQRPLLRHRCQALPSPRYGAGSPVRDVSAHALCAGFHKPFTRARAAPRDRARTRRRLRLARIPGDVLLGSEGPARLSEGPSQ
jgi:hypothetical protein